MTSKVRRKAQSVVDAARRADLSEKALARAILVGDIRRPRIGEVRRLAEAFLACSKHAKKVRADSGGKKSGGKKGKKRKLARIPSAKPD